MKYNIKKTAYDETDVRIFFDFDLKFNLSLWMNHITYHELTDKQIIKLIFLLETLLDLNELDKDDVVILEFEGIFEIRYYVDTEFENTIYIDDVKIINHDIFYEKLNSI